MIVVVTGGRNYDGTGLVEKLNGINKLEKIELMVLGDATGADSIALNWAKINNIPYVVKKAEWRKFGRAAGPTRNSAMIELAKSHLITENKRVVCPRRQWNSRL